MVKLLACFPPLVMIRWHPLVCLTTGWTGPKEEAHRSQASRALNGPPGLLRDNADPSTRFLLRPSRCRPLSSNSKPFFSSKQYWALSYSLLYVHVSSSWVSCSLGGFQKAIFASYCVEANMSAALANGKIKVSVRSNSCADRCLYFELGNV